MQAASRWVLASSGVIFMIIDIGILISRLRPEESNGHLTHVLLHICYLDMLDTAAINPWHCDDKYLVICVVGKHGVSG